MGEENKEQNGPGEIAWRAIEPIWERISIYDGPEIFVDQFRSVDLALGHLFATHWCESEVANGGFHQFFTNSTGVLAPEAAEGFRALGLPDCAAAVEEAMAFFGAPYPRGRWRRQEMLGAVPGESREEWDPFYRLDDRFYELIDYKSGRFWRAADEYARRAAS